MEELLTQELQKGIRTALIDSSYNSNLSLRPMFLSNDYSEGQKVLSSIEEELLNCRSFRISVAFITMSGITPLLQTLRTLEQRGIPGRIMTTDYLHFSEPAALDKLSRFSNLELRMYRCNDARDGFHTKGYLFEQDGMLRVIVGSSNLTLSALTTNKEWNTRLISTEQGEYAQRISEEYERLWNSEYTIRYADCKDSYATFYSVIKKQREQAAKENPPSLEAYRLQPNSMQVNFIKNLSKIISEGSDRALLISATGTGKTYASAFAMREMGYRRVLFVVHRTQICKQAKRSFETVFGSSVRTGLMTGSVHDSDADYVFATVQTLSKTENLEMFSPDYFDACIYDEAHHTSAGSYKRILDYFRPRFTLGMTATPDKRDDNIEGQNIYEIFDHNIAYEIRLQQAMEEKLLCPFHYFGITDLAIISDEGKTREEKLENFRYLTSDDRVEYIMDQAEYFGYSGDRVKGLIFCSRIDEARELARKFNEKGLRTIALSGEDPEAARNEAIDRLTKDIVTDNAIVNGYGVRQYLTDDGILQDYLDYIITVDIFSEGTDIVEVNQVIMLRPTQSPIVFIQQLGRGLRKSYGKEYVVILDFIGNYQNNFMIPIALSGDRTYNKDNIRRYVMEGSRVIPGASTIHFDEISKKRIYESIDRMSTPLKMLKEKYQNLKDRLGRIPTVLEFYEYGEVDPMIFMEYTKESYHSFVRKVDKEYCVRFSEEQEQILNFISQILANGKRPHELLMLRDIIDNSEVNPDKIKADLNSYRREFVEKDYLSAKRVLDMEWINAPGDKSKYINIELIDAGGSEKKTIRRARMYEIMLRNNEFRKQVNDLIEYGLKRYEDNYADTDDLGFTLYQKYSRKDVCRILNWEKDDSSTMYGYRYKYGTCPIFVTLEKKEDISASTKYEDRFDSMQMFNWMTRSKVSIDSVESQKIIQSQENGDHILLFVKKSDGEGTDFYYIGKVKPAHYEQTTIQNDRGEELPIMNFKLQLENAVREDIYDYLTA